MPLYKVTEKRLKKRQREEEDEEALKEAIKVLEQENGASGSESAEEEDDEESGDEESDEEDEEDDEDEDDDMESVGTMDSEEDSSDEEDDEEGAEDDDEAAEPQSENEDEEEASEEEDTFHLTIPQVATEPIYPLPTPPHKPGTQSCVLCPGKLLGNEHMVTIHLEAKSHKRAMSRWVGFLEKAEKEGRELEGDPRFFIEEILDRVEERKEPGNESTPLPMPAKTQGATPVDTETKTKNSGRKFTKKQRKEHQAQKMLEAAAAAGIDPTAAPAPTLPDTPPSAESSTPPADSTRTPTPEAIRAKKSARKQKAKARKNAAKAEATAEKETAAGETNGEVKLNRKARRMAAQAVNPPPPRQPKTQTDKPKSDGKPAKQISPNPAGSRRERRAASKLEKGARKRSKQDEKQKAKAFAAKQEYYAAAAENGVELAEPKPWPKKRKVEDGEKKVVEPEGPNRKARRAMQLAERKAAVTKAEA